MLNSWLLLWLAVAFWPNQQSKNGKGDESQTKPGNKSKKTHNNKETNKKINNKEVNYCIHTHCWLSVWWKGCTSGGVYVPCIYTHAGWELLQATRVFVVVLAWRIFERWFIPLCVLILPSMMVWQTVHTPSPHSLDAYIAWILFLFSIVVVSEQLSWSEQDQTLGASHFEIVYMIHRCICVSGSLFSVLRAQWLHCWGHLRIQPWKITVVLNMLKFSDSLCSAVSQSLSAEMCSDVDEKLIHTKAFCKKINIYIMFHVFAIIA